MSLSELHHERRPNFPVATHQARPSLGHGYDENRNLLPGWAFITRI